MCLPRVAVVELHRDSAPRWGGVGAVGWVRWCGGRPVTLYDDRVARGDASMTAHRTPCWARLAWPLVDLPGGSPMLLALGPPPQP